jgi:Ca2+-binding RTX toxin-like protein
MISVLGKDPDGMWLMIEGGDIDWAAHDNNMDNPIGATLDFDKAVGSVIAWINANGGWADNELIVTADHDHYLTLNGDFPTIARNAKDVNGINTLTSNNTIAGSGQQWGTTANDKYGWGNHTNRPVPVYYQGPESSLLTSAFGSAGDDIFDAKDGKGGNRMSGGAGNDTFFLGSNDRALGGDGNDRFFVGTGGSNLLSGGAGADQFWLYNGEAPTSANTILDFQIGTDVLGINAGGAIKFADLTRTGNDIAIRGNTLATLTGVDTTTLTASNFVFI